MVTFCYWLNQVFLEMVVERALNVSKPSVQQQAGISTVVIRKTITRTVAYCLVSGRYFYKRQCHYYLRQGIYVLSVLFIRGLRKTSL